MRDKVDDARRIERLKVMRLMALLASIFLPAFAVLYSVGDPQYPVGQCLALAGYFALGLLLSYVSEVVAGRLELWMYAGLYVVTAWGLSLTANANFTVEYAVGMMMGIFVISLVFTDYRQLAAYAVFALGSTAIAISVSSRPEVYPPLYLMFLLTMGVVSYFVLRSRLKYLEQLEQAKQRLRHDAVHDALTGLPNRQLFADRLSRAIRFGRRHLDYQYAVLFLDLDNFKTVNDSLGHFIGDELLKASAELVGGCIREGDTLARLGGDEFTILLDGISDLSDAVRVAERVQEALAKPMQVEGHEVFASVSLGIALGASGYESAAEVLRDADTAMYRAKDEGRGRFIIFDESMHERVRERMQLETDLRHAVARGELRVFFQPIVSLETGRIVGAEALVRWRHPQLGLLAPDTFVPLAEETRAIVPIGNWVLLEACRTVRGWAKRNPACADLQLSVNASRVQLTDGEIVGGVKEALEQTGFDGRRLHLEITERALTEPGADGAVVYRQLHDLAVKVAIDDFGTGHSSLASLHEFPVDEVKIDKSFIDRLTRATRDFETVRAILALVRNLDLEAVAEGVENASQVDALRQLGCRYAQGYWFARPLEPDAMEALLIDNPIW